MVEPSTALRKISLAAGQISQPNSLIKTIVAPSPPSQGDSIAYSCSICCGDGSGEIWEQAVVPLVKVRHTERQT